MRLRSASLNRFEWANYRGKYRKKTQQSISDFKVFNDSCRVISKEYCLESSISGLKYLVKDNISFFERVIWIVTLVGALICSVSLVWVTFSKYYRAPLVTTQMPEGVSVSDIIFPAVGLCTNNRISKHAATEFAIKLLKEERNKQYDLKKMLSMLFGLGQLYNLQPMTEGVVEPERLHYVLGDYDIIEIMRNLTPRCEDILLRCSWNDEPRNCLQLFDFRLTANGYCCTFNYLRQSDIKFDDHNSNSRSLDMYKYGNKSAFDYDQGLKVLLKLNKSDDFYYNLPLRGAQLQFSDAYDFPDFPSGSFAMQIVNPNQLMTVFVSASFTEASRDTQHIPINQRSCLFYDESHYLQFYTYSDCLLKCRMLFLLAKCKCTPFNMPKMKEVRTCDMRDVPCLKIYHAQSVTVRPSETAQTMPELELDDVNGGISCPMCYPTCSKTAYYYDFYNVHLFYKNLNDEDDVEDWLIGANFTDTSIVHVKYATEIAALYGQNVMMKWFDLISNIGSTCGFVTGFSFISVLEFIYFFTVKLYRAMKARKRNEHLITMKFDSTINKKINPTDKCRPIYWSELTGSIPYGPSAMFH